MTTPTAPNSSASLASWLQWVEATHPDEIELGLARAAEVAKRANIHAVKVPIITVAGTNGKGSTVAMLNAIYQQAGYRTGVYTSPHIVDFNERIAVDGEPCADDVLVAAFAAIELARDNTALTYFEFSTLAAMQVFIEQQCQVILLEVGLGGRLDTTNVWDTDCAIVTSIAIDHESWLGSDRVAIGLEKIGIGRAGVPLIMGDQDAPKQVVTAIERANMQLHQVPVETERQRLSLTLPGAHQQANAHAALMAVAQLNARLPVPLTIAIDALSQVQVAGRFEQHRMQDLNVVLDVAHNPAAAASVRVGLQERFPDAPVFVVFGALSDKDVAGVVTALGSAVRHWHCVALANERGTPAAQLCALVTAAGGTADAHEVIADAWQAACEQANAYNSEHSPSEAVVLVAGSFFTLTALHEHWQDVGRSTR